MKTIKFNEEIHDESQRCKASTARGACQHVAIEDTERCPHHGANKIIQKKKKERLMNYNLTKFKAEVAEKSGSDNIKSLKDEIGMLRQLLESVWNSCENGTELILNSAVISDLAIKIQKCITETSKLDVLNDKMVEKDELTKFGIAVITKISEVIDDKKAISEISEAILSMLDPE